MRQNEDESHSKSAKELLYQLFLCFLLLIAVSGLYQFAWRMLNYDLGVFP